jgi:hypothetical protein
MLQLRMPVNIVIFNKTTKLRKKLSSGHRELVNNPCDTSPNRVSSTPFHSESSPMRHILGEFLTTRRIPKLLNEFLAICERAARSEEKTMVLNLSAMDDGSSELVFYQSGRPAPDLKMVEWELLLTLIQTQNWCC